MPPKNGSFLPRAFASAVLLLSRRSRRLSGPAVSARVADDRLTRFLYADFPGNADGAVSEYQIHTTKSGDYERDGGGSGEDDDDLGLGRRRRPPGSEYEEQQHVRPYFLESDVDDPRVVQFYSPWCGRCQGFRPTYVAVAEDVIRRHSDQEHHPVAFHAVSCSAHHWVCETYGAREFPTVRAYRAGSFEGTAIEPERFDAESVAEALGIALERDAGARAAHDGNERVGGGGGAPEEGDDDDRYASAAVGSGGNLDIRGASIDVYRRTKNDLYKDAALSFSHALKTEVFAADDVSLTPERRDALSEWLDLLYWTLPPTWQLHTLIHDLRGDLDAALESRESLVRRVDAHAPVVHGTDRPRWTDSCAGSSSKSVGGTAADGEGEGKGDGHPAGYRCGLWALFHIASVGVSERHAAVLGARDRVSTAHAARTLRDYVEHFGGDGDAVCGHRRGDEGGSGGNGGGGGPSPVPSGGSTCRRRLLDIFDSCGFDHCRRFQQQGRGKRKRKGGAAAPAPAETWAEFPLFVWEAHNDMSAAPVRERAEAEGRKADGDEVRSAMWPSRGDCRRCWRDNGGWNREAVLSYLRTEYWPGGVQNFRFVVLGKKDKSNPEPEQSPWSRVRAPFLFAAVLLFTTLFNKWQKIPSGRHKKFDDSV